MSRLRQALGLLEACSRQLSHGSQLQPHTALPLSSLPSALAPTLPMSTSTDASATRGCEECSSSYSVAPSQAQGQGAPSYMHATRRATALSRAASPALPCSTALAPILQRGIHTSTPAAHGGSSEGDSEETISVTFVDKDGKDQEVRAPLGKNLLEVAHDNEVDLEGACEGSLACSTCHVIVEDEEYFKKLPEPCDDELDMLDLAFDLKETSRLGCQIVAAKELDGLRVRLPSATRNFYVDGHKPKPH